MERGEGTAGKVEEGGDVLLDKMKVSAKAQEGRGVETRETDLLDLVQFGDTLPCSSLLPRLL